MNNCKCQVEKVEEMNICLLYKLCIVYLTLVSIFMTTILNSLSGKSLISTLLKAVSGGLSYSFAWKIFSDSFILPFYASDKTSTSLTVLKE